MEFGNTWLPDLNKPGMRTEDKLRALNEYLIAFDKQVRHVLSNIDEANFSDELQKSLSDTSGKVKELEEGRVKTVRTLDGKEPDEKGNIDTDWKKIFNFVYPVGSIVELTIPTHPHELWGIGTWEPYMAGRVLVGAGTADSGTVYEAGQTGGEETHALTVDEMPSHSHETLINTNNVYSGATGNNTYGVNTSGKQPTSIAGGSKPHNIMQPYGVVYRWLRTA